MKALVRTEGEIVTEDMSIPGIDWDTGMPLTCPDWAGGPYILMNDYVPEDPAPCKAKGAVQAPPAQAPAAAPAQDPPTDTIVIDGVTYIRTP